QACATALSWLHAYEYSPQIASLLQDGESEVRVDAAEALGWLRAHEYAPQIAALLNEPEDNVKRTAIQALVAIDARGCSDRIVALLESARRPFSFDFCRSEAIKAAGVLGATAAIPALLRLAEEGGTDAASVVIALGRIGAEAPKEAARIAERLE